MLSAGQHVELAVERPAVGGWMIARHDGRIVLVEGAIPGERVMARIDRVERQLAFATTADVLSPSRHRREGSADLRCGGCSYAHITYARQLSLKGEVIADAFARLGRMPLEDPPAVAESPERGYRMRARLHVRGGRTGFYREGTHTLCDARATGQLDGETLATIEQTVSLLNARRAAVASVEVTENMPGSDRALYLELAPGAGIDAATLDMLVGRVALTGCVARTAEGSRVTAGAPAVADSLASLTHGRAATGELHRQPESFFQANRFLLPDLVVAVLDAVPEDGAVLDLYAGVGLFSVALAATGRTGIAAVEGARSSGSDLQRNARPFSTAVRVVHGRVEDYLRQRPPATDTIIVDPPRTGVSRGAIGAVAALRAKRILYVSCDPATMARDARRLIDAGYRLDSLRAFDLFPNTPHVECVGLFDAMAGG